jgi:hypothetical protein
VRIETPAKTGRKNHQQEAAKDYFFDAGHRISIKHIVIPGS